MIGSRRITGIWRCLFVLAVSVLLTIGTSVPHSQAQLDSDLQAYTDAANSVLTALEQGNADTVEQLMPSLENADKAISDEMSSAILKIRAVMVSTDLYADSDGSLGETFDLVGRSGFLRHLGGDLIMAWLAAEDSEDISGEDKEAGRQAAIKNLTDAVSLTGRAVEDLNPLVERLAGFDTLPAALFLNLPGKMSFSSRSDVQIRVTITNAGEAPAKDVVIVLEDMNDESELTTQRSKVGTIPGATSVVHTFFVDVPEDVTRKTMVVKVESKNAFGDFEIAVIDISSP